MKYLISALFANLIHFSAAATLDLFACIRNLSDPPSSPLSFEGNDAACDHFTTAFGPSHSYCYGAYSFFYSMSIRSKVGQTVYPILPSGEVVEINTRKPAYIMIKHDFVDSCAFNGEEVNSIYIKYKNVENKDLKVGDTLGESGSDILGTLVQSPPPCPWCPEKKTSRTVLGLVLHAGYVDTHENARVKSHPISPTFLFEMDDDVLSFAHTNLYYGPHYETLWHESQYPGKPFFYVGKDAAINITGSKCRTDYNEFHILCEDKTSGEGAEGQWEHTIKINERKNTLMSNNEDLFQSNVHFKPHPYGYSSPEWSTTLVIPANVSAAMWDGATEACSVQCTLNVYDVEGNSMGSFDFNGTSDICPVVDGYACEEDNDCVTQSCFYVGSGYITSCGGRGLFNGEACTFDNNCDSGRCANSSTDFSSSVQGQCAPILGIGETCSRDADCFSGRCTTDSSLTCENQLPIRSICSKDSDCKSGNCLKKKCELTETSGPCRDDQLDIFRTCRVSLNDNTAVYNYNVITPPAVDSGRELYVVNQKNETLYVSVNALRSFDSCDDKLELEAELLNYFDKYLLSDEAIVRCVFIKDSISDSEERDAKKIDKTALSLVLTLEFDSAPSTVSSTRRRKLGQCGRTERALCQAQTSIDPSGCCCGYGNCWRRELEDVRRRDLKKNSFISTFNSAYDLTITDVLASLDAPDTKTVSKCYFFRLFTISGVPDPTCKEYSRYVKFGCENLYRYDSNVTGIFDDIASNCGTSSPESGPEASQTVDSFGSIIN